MSKWVDLIAQDGTVVPAWLASPGSSRLRGAVVVAQEIFGVNRHIQAVASRFAARGFLAIAPSLFTRLQHNVALGYTPDDVALGEWLQSQAQDLPGPGVLDDVRAAVQWLGEQRPGLRVGIVGFGWGGLLAWQAAEQVRGLSAAVCYYGDGMTRETERARQPHCPVLAHFAQRNRMEPFAGALEFNLAHREVEMYIYEANHGFNCDQRPADYDSISATQAKDRTLAFLDKHLDNRRHA